jgi:cob(I)alamin adenosyltransferase
MSLFFLGEVLYYRRAKADIKEMKIYTKTGDKGDTSLFGGKRVPKSSLRIETFGTIDELNAQIGMVRSLDLHADIEPILGKLQNQLFIIGADLATPLDGSKDVERIQQRHIEYLEKTIDTIDAKLEPLKCFILPGGTQASSQLHAARSICRRAERHADALNRTEAIGPYALIYLNRLSDLLFVLARYDNRLSGIDEIKWDGGSGI